jgi:phosphoesterase RecJ-like protein
MTVAENIYQAISNAHAIVITAHKSPDGDSIGSSMALFHLLQKWNKNVIHRLRGNAFKLQ